jgi:Ca2+-binding EF-hand superfamily protein
MIPDLKRRKLMRLFCLYDINNDGFLQFKDFEQRIEALLEIKNLSKDSAIYNQLKNKYYLYWLKLKNEADVNRDGQISIEEWLNYFDQVLQDQMKYQREVESLISTILDIFDSNKDGQLDREEWQQFLESYNISPIYVDVIFPLFDLNNDGFINKTELLKGFHDFFFSEKEHAKGNFLFGPF